MWNPNLHSTSNSQTEDDSSWEVKAFAEDTKNAMDTTWPPRSYTCMFCKREFRSAQALGGHMNVHRRDRAYLNQTQPKLKNPNNFSSSTSSTLLIPTQEIMMNKGLCLLYSLPKPVETNFNNPSVLNSVPVSPRSNIDNLMNFQAIVTTPSSFDSFVSNSSNNEASTSSKCKNVEKFGVDHKKRRKNELTVYEGIDLELRLGYI
ncbi:uncharacterized protein [Rutidosis leptorrhynchoides]|uniref:uncharacterized protein n=1 Tax=Rutidosis leptorrhynchoides TaxID=125765 RepID=UPI003A99FE5D